MENKRDIISNVLTKLSFINWDRYFGEEELTFFGWINREKDKYKDFVTITFDERGLILSYATSSAEHTGKIAEVLNCYHLPCHRVEYFCDGDNIIKEDDTNSAESEPDSKPKDI